MSNIQKRQDSEDWESGTQTLAKEKREVKQPRMYRVILLNDDYTPMEFVVWLIQTVFHKPLEEATQLMLEIHQKGSSCCGIYPYDVARTKVYQVKNLAQKEGHPLECIMEVEEAHP